MKNHESYLLRVIQLDLLAGINNICVNPPSLSIQDGLQHT